MSYHHRQQILLIPRRWIDQVSQEIEETEEVIELEGGETQSGYDFDLLKKDQNVKDLECAICYSLLRNAHSTPCHHAFCHGCLVAWNKQQHNGWR